MTSERKKSLLILSLTLVFGILVGLLLPGFFHKLNQRENRGHGGRHGDRDHKREWFVGAIYRIVKPDSAQVKQIKPITDWASQRIDSIETSANQQMSSVLDSVRSQLKLILTEDQQKRLAEFDTRAKRNWKEKK